MKPRLKTSKKWTAFPKEYADQIKAVFLENFTQELADKELKVEGRIYPSEITLRIGFIEKGRLAGANFEVSSEYNSDGNQAVEKIHVCVDAAAAMMTEYFETQGDVDFPYLWKEVAFGAHKVFVQYSTENPDLEAEANRLLGATEDSMMVEDDENDMDALAHAEIDEEISPARDEEDYQSEGSDDEIDSETELNEDNDDEIDNQPRMFGKAKKIKKEDMH